MRAVLAFASADAAAVLRSVLVPGRKSLPGRQDTAVPAVGTDSVSHRCSVLRLSPPPRIRAVCHRLCRFTPRIGVVAPCFYSLVSACSRGPSSPASPSVPRSLPLGRPGPGGGGRLPTLRAGLFRCFREPEVSLPRRSRVRRPHAARPPPPPHSASLRVLWHWKTHRRLPLQQFPEITAISRIHRAAYETSSTIG